MIPFSMTSCKKIIKKRKTGQLWNLKPNKSQTYRSGKSQPGHVVKNGEEGDLDGLDYQGHSQRNL
jgi:hypothetical protein